MSKKHSGKNSSEHHSHEDHHYGNSGNTFTLSNAADSMTGGNGADIFIATTDTLSTGDVIDGGTGKNVLSLSGGGNFDLRLPTTLTGIQSVRGDSLADQIVSLRDGADLKFSGGNGNNAITTGSTGNQEIKLGNGNNTITGGGSNNEIQVGSGTNTIIAGSGATEVKLGTGTNTVTGGSGTLEVKSSGGSNTIIGGTGAMKVYSGSGKDLVTSGNSDDYIFGGKGALVFTGTSGNDTLALGKGSIVATLGSGSDTIKISHGHGTADISNFTQGSDKIDLHCMHLSDFAALQNVATITADTAGTTIQFADGPTLDLIGVTSITTTDFVFA